jgi:hypothetical protein
MKTLRNLFSIRTANDDQMRLSAAICTANIAEVADGEWALIAPYGEHPAPNGQYVQKFDRSQADTVVTTWNSITGTAARVFKNLWHGLGPKKTLPVWDGHPETDRARWPKEKLLAEITDLRTGDDGLEGRITWNARGAESRSRGPLFPSPLWWHWPPSGEPPTVFPELLESIGLVPTPNIAGVPAWTQNAAPEFEQKETEGTEADLRPPTSDLRHPNPLATDQEAEAPTQTGENTDMNKQRIIELLKLAADATDEQIETALAAASTSTANAATMETQVAALTTERDTLATANGALTTTNAALIDGALNLAEARGAITPAERETFREKLTANASATIDELKPRKALNTQAIEINGNRIDLSTANSRAELLEKEIAKRQQADSTLDRAAAMAKCQADPALKPLFDAMQDPTRKAQD